MSTTALINTAAATWNTTFGGHTFMHSSTDSKIGYFIKERYTFHHDNTVSYHIAEIAPWNSGVQNLSGIFSVVAITPNQASLQLLWSDGQAWNESVFRECGSFRFNGALWHRTKLAN